MQQSITFTTRLSRDEFMKIAEAARLLRCSRNQLVIAGTKAEIARRLRESGENRHMIDCEPADHN